ncbi:class IV adenylate cyclase [Kitasatospora sp. DSM 101779]|uniref:class IV adenylate cyclase n=1 Tax=Kitasatospora sp. DSM 101779 TaxID=2853165 RepID=UPI0021D8A118|nr:CYTH domain-containing protein [Kitasatospora sp. DSM 101779]MCU7822426.1 CYTH domain-containing protein [Kitasatospora sp. DSM 101779]
MSGGARRGRAVEAELKAVVRDPTALRARLDALAGPGRAEVYRDTYYDLPDGSLAHGDRELRLRTVTGPADSRTLLTWKDARVDAVSGAKPEAETAVTDPAGAAAVLRGLGYRPVLAFEKHCRNHTLHRDGRDLLATLVEVPELAGAFLEVETVCGEDELPAALAAVRGVLAELGVPPADLTAEAYTDAVAAARGRSGGV